MRTERLTFKIAPKYILSNETQISCAVTMLQTRLVKLANPKTPSGATDDGSEIGHPRAEFLPPTLFSKTSTPESIEDDLYDPKFSTLNYQMKSFFTETGNTESKFFWMIDLMSFRQLFRIYSKFGDNSRSGETMSLTCSDKWLRQAKIIDNRRISTTDTGIYFKQIAKYRKSLSFNSYQLFLELLAQKKRLNLSEMKYKMVTCGPPESYKTTEVDNRNASYELHQRPRQFKTFKKRKPVRNYDSFFSNCQCQHGYNSNISYCFPDEDVKTTHEEQEEDWFPED